MIHVSFAITSCIHVAHINLGQFSCIYVCLLLFMPTAGSYYDCVLFILQAVERYSTANRALLVGEQDGSVSVMVSVYDWSRFLVGRAIHQIYRHDSD